LLVSDVDEDGDLDLLCGNIGMNNRFTTSTEYPITLISNDFDGNGSLDPIMCFYYQEKLYPFASRDAIIGQIPSLKKKYTRYTAYASASLTDIFSKSDLEAGSYFYVHTLKSTLFKNENKKFNPVELPYQVQLSPVNGMLLEDVNHDGRKDIVMAGNFNFSDTETGEMNAGNGTLLLQQQDGSFIFVSNREHGFWAQKDARDLKAIKLSGGMNAIITGNNRGPLELSVLHSPIH